MIIPINISWNCIYFFEFSDTMLIIYDIILLFEMDFLFYFRCFFYIRVFLGLRFIRMSEYISGINVSMHRGHDQELLLSSRALRALTTKRRNLLIVSKRHIDGNWHNFHNEMEHSVHLRAANIVYVLMRHTWHTNNFYMVWRKHGKLYKSVCFCLCNMSWK